MNYTQKTCVKPYSKVRNNTYDYLASKNVSPKSRLTYSVLGTYLDYDSSNSRATYDQLLEGCGFGSYQTVSRCLKELNDKGLIIKIGRSRYKLTYGIYMGIIENENKTEKTIPSSLSQKKQNTTPSVVKENPPIYSTLILNNNKLRKSRHEQSTRYTAKWNDDEISKLKFKKDSAFSKIPKSTLYKMIKRYGIETLQDRIKRLDGCYTPDMIRKSPESLLYGALNDNGEWEYKTKTGEVVNLRYPDSEKTRETLLRDKEVRQVCNGARVKMDVFKSSNPVLVEKFRREIQGETPRVIGIPFMYEIAMNAKISEHIGGVK